MKTEISEHDRQILASAYHILQELDSDLWIEYMSDCKSDGTVKYYGTVHKAARCTSNIVDGMSKLLRLFKIYTS